jgi:hypothetical protein
MKIEGHEDSMGIPKTFMASFFMCSLYRRLYRLV